MAQNFLACDREQVFLMPPDVRDWLPEGHLAWFVLDAVTILASNRRSGSLLSEVRDAHASSLSKSGIPSSSATATRTPTAYGCARAATGPLVTRLPLRRSVLAGGGLGAEGTLDLRRQGGGGLRGPGLLGLPGRAP